MIVVAGRLVSDRCPEGRDGGRDEYPRHDVFVNTLAIDTFEVSTQPLS